MNQEKPRKRKLRSNRTTSCLKILLILILIALLSCLCTGLSIGLINSSQDSTYEESLKRVAKNKLGYQPAQTNAFDKQDLDCLQQIQKEFFAAYPPKTAIFDEYGHEFESSRSTDLEGDEVAVQYEKHLKDIEFANRIFTKYRKGILRLVRKNQWFANTAPLDLGYPMLETRLVAHPPFCKIDSGLLELDEILETLVISGQYSEDHWDHFYCYFKIRHMAPKIRLSINANYSDFLVQLNKHLSISKPPSKIKTLVNDIANADESERFRGEFEAYTNGFFEVLINDSEKFEELLADKEPAVRRILTGASYLGPACRAMRQKYVELHELIMPYIIAGDDQSLHTAFEKLDEFEKSITDGQGSVTQAGELFVLDAAQNYSSEIEALLQDRARIRLCQTAIKLAELEELPESIANLPNDPFIPSQKLKWTKVNTYEGRLWSVWDDYSDDGGLVSYDERLLDFNRLQGGDTDLVFFVRHAPKLRSLKHPGNDPQKVMQALQALNSYDPNQCFAAIEASMAKTGTWRTPEVTSELIATALVVRAYCAKGLDQLTEDQQLKLQTMLFFLKSRQRQNARLLTRFTGALAKIEELTCLSALVHYCNASDEAALNSSKSKAERQKIVELVNHYATNWLKLTENFHDHEQRILCAYAIAVLESANQSSDKSKVKALESWRKLLLAQAQQLTSRAPRHSEITALPQTPRLFASLNDVAHIKLQAFVANKPVTVNNKFLAKSSVCDDDLALYILNVTNQSNAKLDANLVKQLKKQWNLAVGRQQKSGLFAPRSVLGQLGGSTAESAQKLETYFKMKQQ